jgi:hypothetical protein
MAEEEEEEVEVARLEAEVARLEAVARETVARAAAVARAGVAKAAAKVAAGPRWQPLCRARHRRSSQAW